MDRWPALAVAVVATAAVALAPVGGLSASGQYALAVMAFAAVLWITEGLPLPVTALCIPVLLTAFGVTPSFTGAVSGFADPVIFLMLAGFVLAVALQKYGIDRRVAYHLLAALGSSPRRLVLAVMVTTAVLSMVVSNTATTAMMAPIALGVAEEAAAAGGRGKRVTGERSNLAVAALLGTAYAASLGGLGTLIGSPPNAIVAGQLEQRLGYDLTFVDWLFVGLPLVFVTVPLTWFVLLRVYPPQVTDVSAARRQARESLADLDALGPRGRRVVAIGGATAALWLLGGLGFLFADVLPAAWYATLFGGSESVVGGPHQGLLYFVLVGMVAIPVLVAAGTVEWDDVQRIDWGTLILLGGGLSLADALGATGAIGWFADVAFDALAGTPVVVVVLVVVAGTVALGELASNTAMAAIIAPLLITLGPRYAGQLGAGDTTASVFLAVTGAVAASIGFALPVATPPNAIVFGTGEITKDDMLRPGVVLDVTMILVTTALLYVLLQTLWPVVLGP